MRVANQGARGVPVVFAATLLCALVMSTSRRTEAAPETTSPGGLPAPSTPSTPATVPPAALPGAAPSLQPVPSTPERPRQTVTWDLNLDGAIGHSFEGEGHLSGFGRVRGGLLLFNESDLQAPVFYALGLTYELSDFSPATFGLQVEAISLNSGLWLQLGAMVDVQPRPGAMAAVGFSLVGAEAQVRWSEGEGAFFALFAKLRIPLGVIAVALKD